MKMTYDDIVTKINSEVNMGSDTIIKAVIVQDTPWKHVTEYRVVNSNGAIFACLEFEAPDEDCCITEFSIIQEAK